MNIYIRLRLALLAIMLALFVAEKSVAQGGIVVTEGQQKSLAVVPNVGETYVWQIFNKPTFLPADLATQTEVDYVSGSVQPVLPVLWKKQGDYYFTVTVFSSKGCKNMKVGHVRVMVAAISAVAGRDTTIGACSSLILDASKSKGVGLSYKWLLLDPGGVLSSDNTITTSLSLSPGYAGPLPFTMRVLLTVTNNFGDLERDTIRVTFGALPKVGIVYPVNPNKDGSLLIDGSASEGMGLKYRWFTTTKGEIIGDASKSQVLIKGVGFYSLEVTDIYGCKSLKTFQYPFETNELIANADYVRTSWVDTIHVHVLNNDYDSGNAIIKSSLQIIQKPIYGKAQAVPDGTIIYSPNTRRAAVDNLVYRICDAAGACDTALVTIDIFDGPVWVPEAISPNGDGQNETFVIRGLQDYKNSTLTIYTRAGQQVYKSTDYQNDWAGRTLNSGVQDGVLLPTGTYYYVLHLGGTSRVLKGFVYLLY